MPNQENNNPSSNPNASEDDMIRVSRKELEAVVKARQDEEEGRKKDREQAEKDKQAMKAEYEKQLAEARQAAQRAAAGAAAGAAGATGGNGAKAAADNERTQGGDGERDARGQAEPPPPPPTAGPVFTSTHAFDQAGRRTAAQGFPRERTSDWFAGTVVPGAMAVNAEVQRVFNQTNGTLGKIFNGAFTNPYLGEPAGKIGYLIGNTINHGPEFAVGLQTFAASSTAAALGTAVTIPAIHLIRRVGFGETTTDLLARNMQPRHGLARYLTAWDRRAAERTLFPRWRSRTTRKLDQLTKVSDLTNVPISPRDAERMVARGFNDGVLLERAGQSGVIFEERHRPMLDHLSNRVATARRILDAKITDAHRRAEFLMDTLPRSAWWDDTKRFALASFRLTKAGVYKAVTGVGLLEVFSVDHVKRVVGFVGNVAKGGIEYVKGLLPGVGTWIRDAWDSAKAAVAQLPGPWGYQ